MPHLTIHYTPNVDTDMDALCHVLLDTVLGIRDDEDKAVFPPGGMRVMAFPAAHFAVGDGKGDYGFVYINLRINPGRSAQIVARTGDRMMEAVKQHIEPLFSRWPMGITLNIEESPASLPGPAQLLYEGFHNNLRAHLAK
ncbi:5-carboxymethyl-2-hydroxymuconate Delta-isomerase [Rhizobium deserti]|uniref:5-carboxymethyl-2-hydroxymuconate Delta-isomerase n=1 Tax=Rhizobium deserti TaxID=2547961 RepID=A0A4R5ULS3_9HYPH|nr:5-carboxymethyl-2-hydroxymuconate Delta-isomerase [Rhizobium deserti]TDK38678.1 5-carboxymethyl-2-hydroxymuconate Delta-isomerase [Rhizobium deserti]